MQDLLPLLAISVVVFASTNVDDLFVLLGFYADPRFSPRSVAAGQFIGIGALYAASVVGSLVSLVLRPELVGLLGVLPIAIGIKKAYDAMNATGRAEAEPERPASAAGLASVVAVTVANGGDSLGIYTPLFATRPLGDVMIIGLVFAFMTALWLGVAHWLVSHRTLGAPIRRYGHRVVPFVLIALGVWILYEAGSFDFIRSFALGQ
jgi:cadmium resistance protein CadD (predicted permease)